MNPEVLVLDEPTVGLDAESEQNLMDLLSGLNNNGTSIILATHDMDVVLRYATRALVLENGSILRDETPISLFQDREFLKTSSLEPPKVFSFALQLKERGLPIDLSRIKDCDSLADEIVRVRREHD